MGFTNRNRGLIAAAVLICAAPVQADITAHYADSDGRVVFTAETDAKGNVRISHGSWYAVLKHNGASYIVRQDRYGVYAVKLDDWNAVNSREAKQVAPPSRPITDTAEAPDVKSPDFEIVQGGRETVGGRTGTIWSLKLKDAAVVRANGDGLDFVVSDDHDLAPIGQLLAAEMTTSLTSRKEATGGRLNLSRRIADVYAKGTLIRILNVISLQKVDTTPIPASEFELPATVLTREQCAARLRSQPMPTVIDVLVSP